MLQSTCWQDSTMDLLEICNMVRLWNRIRDMVKSQNLISVLSSINLIFFIINPIKLCEFMSSHEHGQILVRFKSKYPTLGRDEYPTAIWFVPGPDVKTRPFAFNKVGWLNWWLGSNTSKLTNLRQNCHEFWYNCSRLGYLLSEVAKEKHATRHDQDQGGVSIEWSILFLEDIVGSEKPSQR